MSDIPTLLAPGAAQADWQISGTTGDQDLATAVVLSLFTDGEARADDPVPGGDRRGWYGDDGDAVRMGSRLWLLERRKADQATLNDARAFITEAVQWLVDDGVVARFDLALDYDAGNFLAARLVANRRDGSTVAMNFSFAWLALASSPAGERDAQHRRGPHKAERGSMRITRTVPARDERCALALSPAADDLA
jgi:phage gp46-like protein